MKKIVIVMIVLLILIGNKIEAKENEGAKKACLLKSNEIQKCELDVDGKCICTPQNSTYKNEQKGDD